MKNLLSLLLFCNLIQGVSQSFESGEIIDTVKTTVAGQTYALYLPENFKPEKEYGVIFFFEPLARAKLPLNLYKDLADKYELIITCSNNSRNFTPTFSCLDAADAVVKDVFSKFNINEKLVIASGFSGGSRVATAVATQFPAVNGIIGIGAVFPIYPEHRLKRVHKIPYVGLVGNRDFNYTEHYRSEERFKGEGIDNMRLVFNRKHQWAPVDDYHIALIWMMSKLDKSLEDDLLEPTLLNNYVTNLADSVSIIDATRVRAYFHSDFGIELATVSAENFTLPKEEKQLMRALEMEGKLRQQYQDSLNLAFKSIPNRNSNSPLDWIIDAGLSYKRRVGQNEKRKPYRAEMYDRMANFLSGASYEYAVEGMMAQDYNQAYVGVEIWSSMVDNDVWEYWMKCKLHAMNKDIPSAIRYLEKLIKSGFENGKALKADSTFDVLSSTKPYIELTSPDGR